jgi:hypothetical protein
MRAELPTRGLLRFIRECQRAADEAQRIAYGHRLAEYLEKGSHFLPLSRQDRLRSLSMESVQNPWRSCRSWMLASGFH